MAFNMIFQTKYIFIILTSFSVMSCVPNFENNKNVAQNNNNDDIEVCSSGGLASIYGVSVATPSACEEDEFRKEAMRRCTSYELTGVELNKCIDEQYDNLYNQHVRSRQKYNRSKTD